MLPLTDTHVHLLAGLDDGPRDDGEALAMARQLVADGVGSATALAHQNRTFPNNTPAKLTEATALLRGQLRELKIPLTVYPTGEVVLTSEIIADYRAGQLQSVGGAGKYLLAEMPHGVFIDPRETAREFRKLGIRLILAHAERYEPLLRDPALTAECIAAGCLIQVTANAFTDLGSVDGAALRTWATSGMIHILGTDGHRLDFRPPKMRDGYRVLQKWVGPTAAERIGSLFGDAVLQGLPVNPPPPKAANKSWFSKLFGG